VWAGVVTNDTFAPLRSLGVPAGRPEEVKNNVDLNFQLSPELMAMIDLYMREYQPLLCGEIDSSMLFPGRGGQAKCDTVLRRQITDGIWDHMGIHVNPHLFPIWPGCCFSPSTPVHTKTFAACSATSRCRPQSIFTPGSKPLLRSISTMMSSAPIAASSRRRRSHDAAIRIGQA
jgi:hypothetical protein